jgi:hypothetical protein
MTKLLLVAAHLPVRQDINRSFRCVSRELHDMNLEPVKRQALANSCIQIGEDRNESIPDIFCETMLACHSL